MRRNVFCAFLHALLTSHTAQQAADAASLTRSLAACIAFGSRIARSHQRRAMQMEPHGRASSTLLAGCEVEWLGWAAIEVLSHHKHASLGNPALRGRLRRRRRLAACRCELLSAECLPLLGRACNAGGLVRLPT